MFSSKVFSTICCEFNFVKIGSMVICFLFHKLGFGSKEFPQIFLESFAELTHYVANWLVEFDK